MRFAVDVPNFGDLTTLDRLTGGRMILGVGRGGAPRRAL
jgi:alkanesulfonate monooxygenase SsuD/methylene tetrahydromethanopterin reductase-like flavin-dependent oxidoreductase (luciferase family)